MHSRHEIPECRTGPVECTHGELGSPFSDALSHHKVALSSFKTLIKSLGGKTN